MIRRDITRGTGHSKHFNIYERSVLMSLDKSPVDLTSGEIADRLHIHWTTAKKYLNKLEKRGLLKKVDVVGKRVSYEVNPEFVELCENELQKLALEDKMSKLGKLLKKWDQRFNQERKNK